MTTDEMIFALKQAANELDLLWDFDAERGLHDLRGSAEYETASLAPRLRTVAKTIESADRRG